MAHKPFADAKVDFTGSGYSKKKKKGLANPIVVLLAVALQSCCGSLAALGILDRLSKEETSLLCTKGKTKFPKPQQLGKLWVGKQCKLDFLK